MDEVYLRMLRGLMSTKAIGMTNNDLILFCYLSGQTQRMGIDAISADVGLSRSSIARTLAAYRKAGWLTYETGAGYLLDVSGRNMIQRFFLEMQQIIDDDIDYFSDQVVDWVTSRPFAKGRNVNVESNLRNRKRSSG